ncbi:MAG: hypothetical protein QF535_05000, partial [Anaerolineales bacterium]|nr:hypothetical protein [Anaerolineales bacterium]
MATYKGIKGQTVSSQASDPASADDAGLLYYNTASGTFKVVLDGGAPIGAWATGGTMNTGRTELGSAGSQTNALGMGGNMPSPAWSAITEQYNGTAWTEVGDLNTPRRGSGGLGTGSAALCLGAGEAPDFASHVEEWNGTGWTTVASLPAVRGYMPCGTGSVTAGLCFGGGTNPNPTQPLTVEKFNGTGWTEVANVNTGRKVATGCGTASATLFVGGDPGPKQLVEEFNGTSWTEKTDTNSDHAYTGSSGTTSTATVYGDSYAQPASKYTEAWNGSSWTEVADLSADHGSAGSTRTSASAAAYFAGYGPAGAGTKT